MDVDVIGRPHSGPVLRLGAIGCGSHAYRNVFTSLPFLPGRLVACCDHDEAKALAVAERHGANCYCDLDRMLEAEELDAVLIVVGYDKRGRPLYPQLTKRCLAAGLHVWIEKPPAASCAEIEEMQAAAVAASKRVAVGFKKQFMPANRKAGHLMSEDLTGVHQVLARYPQRYPKQEEVQCWRAGENIGGVVSYLDHLCHPTSLLVSWLGLPDQVLVEPDSGGGATLLIRFANGVLANLALCHGAAEDGGMEHSSIIGMDGHIEVHDNLRVELRRSAPLRYGESADYYIAKPAEASSVWEPEHSLGQLFNKGVVQLGYVDELGDFMRAIRETCELQFGTLADAWACTALFEASVSCASSCMIGLPQAPDWVRSTLGGRHCNEEL